MLGQLTFREGSPADLAGTFELSQVAMHDAAVRQGVLPAGSALRDDRIEADWRRQRGLIEFLAAQEGRYLICDGADGPLGYARTVRFDSMEQLTELMVAPGHQHQGIGRRLLEECWPGAPTPELGRVVVAAGSTTDLTLYTEFGTMPVAGHWHMRARTEDYVPLRTAEVDMVEPGVHVLTPERACEEWCRLEPDAIGHERAALHEFFARERSCLALPGEDERPAALCWVSSDGEIGPAIAAAAGDLVPVILAALDRVAKTQEPDTLSVFATSLSWWLLRRLRRLGFQVFWPSWVLCSIPLPGLDRFVPTRPPHVL
ncbi:MAG: GNAT family N-acetyltransferase [Actinomycetota bacterium]|nr:GNAT family N-acetyltransferase [Actinomycetota bacterium]